MRRLGLLVVSSLIGALVGYAAAGSSWPRLLVWLLATGGTYSFVLFIDVVGALFWLRQATDESGVAAVTWALDSDFMRLDAALTVAALAYFCALALPVESTLPARAPMVLSCAMCAIAAVLLRGVPIPIPWRQRR